MLTQADKRAAALAVSRFGADRSRVKRAADVVRASLARGDCANMLDQLVGERLLNAAQARELRSALDKTEIDPTLPLQGASAANATHTSETSSSEIRRLGPYRILRRLGEGGMGSVYLAFDGRRQCQAAIKVLPDELAASQSYVDRFRREARSLARLDHPNVVQFIEIGQDEATGKHYLVLEYVEGNSAHTLLDRLGFLSVGDATHIILNIARGLEHLQARSIVHRDIKPDNVLVTSSGVAKLADLGLAKRIDQDTSLTGTRQGFGTPYYMPYEQACDAKSADGRSDIFALGATFYHLLTGRVPFGGVNALEVAEKKKTGLYLPANSINPQIPDSLSRIIDKMLARLPQARYQNARELVVDLERTGLAAKVPSFIDQSQAIEAPLRARRAEAQRLTRIDPGESRKRSINPNIWYVRHRDGRGRQRKSRRKTWEIISALQHGKISLDALASQDAKGEFKPLVAYPTFAPVIAELQAHPRDPGPKPSKWPSLGRYLTWAGFGLGFLILATGLVVYLFLP